MPKMKFGTLKSTCNILCGVARSNSDSFVSGLIWLYLFFPSRHTKNSISVMSIELFPKQSEVFECIIQRPNLLDLICVSCL